MREPVLDDLAARDEREPRVDAEQFAADDEQEAEEDEPGDDEQVVLRDRLARGLHPARARLRRHASPGDRRYSS